MALPDRAALIAVLDRLESDQDDQALAAARELAAMRRSAGIDWAGLLENFATIADSDDGIDLTDDEEPEVADEGGDASDADAPRLIQALLARTDLSDDTRQDLTDLAAEAQTGNLGKEDSRYVRALHRRLTSHG